MSRFLAVAMLAAACSGRPPPPPAATTGVTVTAATAASTVSVVVTVNPAGASLSLTRAADGTFTGTLPSVGVGLQTFTATAFDAGGQVVAAGSAQVELLPGATARVELTLLDATGPAPVPDHAPILTGASLSAASVAPGVAVALTAAAVDVDGDAVSFAWLADCPGVFADPAAASTSFTPAAAGACRLTVTASARGLSDARVLALQVAAPASTEVVLALLDGGGPLAATVSGPDGLPAPTGTVAFYVAGLLVDTQPLGAPPAACTLPCGRAESWGLRTPHAVAQAVYSGDAVHPPATSTSIDLGLGWAYPEVVADPAGSSLFGQPVTLTGSVTGNGWTGTPTGTVVFRSQSEVGDLVLSGPVPLVAGQATLVTDALPPGFQVLWLEYSGDVDFRPAGYLDGWLTDHDVVGGNTIQICSDYSEGFVSTDLVAFDLAGRTGSLTARACTTLANVPPGWRPFQAEAASRFGPFPVRAYVNLPAAGSSTISLNLDGVLAKALVAQSLPGPVVLRVGEPATELWPSYYDSRDRLVSRRADFVTTWWSSDGAVAAVDAAGRVTPRAPGAALVGFDHQGGGAPGDLSRAALVLVRDPASTALPPIASFTVSGALETRAPTLFDASASADPQGLPLLFRWDFEGDGVWDTPFSASPQAAHAFAAAGTYRPRLLLASGAGLTAEAAQELAVALPDGPRLYVTPAVATVSAWGTLSLTAEVLNLANGAVTWELEPGGGTCSGTGSTCRYTAPYATGTFQVTARSVALPGLAASAAVTVVNQAPWAHADVAGGTGLAPPGGTIVQTTLLPLGTTETFQLDGWLSRDPEGGTLTYEWFLTDGHKDLADVFGDSCPNGPCNPVFRQDVFSSPYVRAPTLSLAQAGLFTVHLRVTDPAGAVGWDKAWIQVAGPLRPGSGSGFWSEPVNGCRDVWVMDHCPGSLTDFCSQQYQLCDAGGGAVGAIVPVALGPDTVDVLLNGGSALERWGIGPDDKLWRKGWAESWRDLYWSGVNGLSFR